MKRTVSLKKFVSHISLLFEGTPVITCDNFGEFRKIASQTNVENNSSRFSNNSICSFIGGDS